jgi:SAM-dependent methyltransferase
MNHSDHVNLLRPANLTPGGVWADFGAGWGAFTLALRELAGTDAEIYAVDKDERHLRELQEAYQARFGDATNLHLQHADFTRPLQLPPLDGAVMANALHYFRDVHTSRLGENTRRPDNKPALLLHLREFLKPGAPLLLVEYNVDTGNLWVPHPLSFRTWQALAPKVGLTEPRLLATHPSSFLAEFYSAVCYKADA